LFPALLKALLDADVDEALEGGALPDQLQRRLVGDGESGHGYYLPVRVSIDGSDWIEK
jgi:hypothetical protein